MKRNIGICLLAVLALAALSCSEDGGKPAETTADAGTAAVQSTGTETEEIDYNALSFLERLKYSNAQIADNLPELSLGGETFKIWLRSEAANPTMSSEETGEVLDDASYAQKRSVEERFDVVIEYDHYAGEWTSSMKRFYSNIMSGDYFADIVENWNATTASSISQGYYMDISGYDVIDIEKPWYFRDEIESGTYRGSFYSVIGFMNPKVVFGDMTCTISTRIWQPPTIWTICIRSFATATGRWTMSWRSAVTSTATPTATTRSISATCSALSTIRSTAGITALHSWVSR